MIIGWPEGIYLTLFGLGLILALICHGEDRGKVDFAVYLARNLLIFGLLYWGGFFA